VSKLAIILVSVAFLSATGVVRADTNAGLQEKIVKLQQEKSFLQGRLSRAIAYSRENRTNLESELAAHKQKSAKERQTLLRRIDRSKKYSRAKIQNLQASKAEWATGAGDILDGKLGGIRGTTVSTNADDSVTVRVGNVGLFRTGGTVLSDEGAELLTTITRALSTTDGNITVVGHTDSVRVGSDSQFANNVELSFARAFSTLNFMRNRGIATERLSAAGYGAEQPIANNNTEKGRQQNRRVEIILRK